MCPDTVFTEELGLSEYEFNVDDGATCQSEIPVLSFNYYSAKSTFQSTEHYFCEVIQEIMEFAGA